MIHSRLTVLFHLFLALALFFWATVIYLDTTDDSASDVQIFYSPSSGIATPPESSMGRSDDFPEQTLPDSLEENFTALPAQEESHAQMEFPSRDYEDDFLIVVQFPLELNIATAEELSFIPGIGDVLSQRIVQYRDVLGGYTDLAQLMEIKGIGQSTYEKISFYVFLEGDGN